MQQSPLRLVSECTVAAKKLLAALLVCCGNIRKGWKWAGGVVWNSPGFFFHQWVAINWDWEDASLHSAFGSSLLGSGLLSALLPWQQLCGRYKQGSCAECDLCLVGGVHLHPAVWSRCQQYPLQTETRTHQFRKFGLNVCSLEFLQGSVTVRIVSAFLLIVLQKWAVEESYR